MVRSAGWEHNIINPSVGVRLSGIWYLYCCLWRTILSIRRTLMMDIMLILLDFFCNTHGGFLLLFTSYLSSTLISFSECLLSYFTLLPSATSTGLGVLAPIGLNWLRCCSTILSSQLVLKLDASTLIALATDRSCSLTCFCPGNFFIVYCFRFITGGRT